MLRLLGACLLGAGLYGALYLTLAGLHRLLRRVYDLESKMDALCRNLRPMMADWELQQDMKRTRTIREYYKQLGL